MTESVWRKCSTCKKDIALRAVYYRCSVSTCRSKATDFAFCTVSCWDAHIGFYNHRNAYAEEEMAPASAETVLIRPAAAVSAARETVKEDFVTEENESKKTIVFRSPTPADQIKVETLVEIGRAHV